VGTIATPSTGALTPEEDPAVLTVQPTEFARRTVTMEKEPEQDGHLTSSLSSAVLVESFTNLNIGLNDLFLVEKEKVTNLLDNWNLDDPSPHCPLASSLDTVPPDEKKSKPFIPRGARPFDMDEEHSPCEGPHRVSRNTEPDRLSNSRKSSTRVVTCNVNGVPSFSKLSLEGEFRVSFLTKIIFSVQPDVLVLQELKTHLHKVSLLKSLFETLVRSTPLLLRTIPHV
jgi:hypothetical protein